MKRWTERVLNIQPGDLGRGILLCACLFLIMSSYVTGRVARDALFLARFQAVQLPYADIASALLVGIVVVGYVRLGQRTSLRNLLVGGGAILGAIFAGYFSKTIAKAFGAESLLLGMASLLFICTVLMGTMWHSWKSRLAASSETPAGDKGIGQRDLQGSMR